ncbi:hypothetical protein, partial [Staphylococcus aureus]
MSRGLGDVYKRQASIGEPDHLCDGGRVGGVYVCAAADAVSYTHLRAHETLSDLVCRLLLEKSYKKTA